MEVQEQGGQGGNGGLSGGFMYGGLFYGQEHGGLSHITLDTAGGGGGGYYGGGGSIVHKNKQFMVYMVVVDHLTMDVPRDNFWCATEEGNKDEGGGVTADAYQSSTSEGVDASGVASDGGIGEDGYILLTYVLLIQQHQQQLYQMLSHQVML